MQSKRYQTHVIFFSSLVYCLERNKSIFHLVRVIVILMQIGIHYVTEFVIMGAICGMK